MKKCPYCAEDIKKDAIKCKHCGEWLKNNGRNSLKKGKQLKLDDSIKKQEKIIKKSKWNIMIIILGILLILIGISKLGKGALEGLFTLIPGITTLLAYFSYKGAVSRINNSKNKYFLELGSLIIFTLIYFGFFKYIKFENIINHPISILPLIIFFGIYIKINFINKNRKKDEVVRIIFSGLVLILGLMLMYSFNNKENIKYNKINNKSSTNNLQNNIIKFNDLIWYDNVSLGNIVIKVTMNNDLSDYSMGLLNLLNFLIDYSDNIKVLKNEDIKNNNFVIGNTCYKNDIQKPCVGNGEYNVNNDLYEMGLNRLYLKLYNNKYFTYYISGKDKYEKFNILYKKYLLQLSKIER